MNKRIARYLKKNGISAKKPSEKKAIIEVSFSWIFILIAGVVILGLFIYIGFNQGSFFKNLLNQQLLSDLNTIFASAMVSRNTAALFQVPEDTFRFSCNSYMIGKSSFPIVGMYVFAPPSLTTSELVTWSQGWNMGFRVTNFLYITSPQIKYYLVYYPDDSDALRLVQKMRSDMPDQLSIELLPVDSSNYVSILNENFDRIHVLAVSSGATRSINFKVDPSIDKQKIHIIYASNVLNYDPFDDTAYSGIIHFIPYQVTLNADFGSFKSSALIGLASLYGALYASDQETYDCILAKAFTRAKLVTTLYAKRAESLGNSLTSCTLYSSTNTVLNSMANNLNPTAINVNELRRNALHIATLNANLEQTSCSLLY